ncbi:hypothetical protein DAPPUDRAFT_325947 [Daphnia pulex]|uniref:Uncharacterized protein n=1 Tax=Daphnia pulex TaxID=6669 RepID=E9H695_DAPPU|nr:hypothetical protein DAPPUDRAFT_325947 [Daphnia pulex]|eukprot:EFX72735.1 hypothetical protein DAPPUDRAFT_325947 [Daphnia pulex]
MPISSQHGNQLGSQFYITEHPKQAMQHKQNKIINVIQSELRNVEAGGPHNSVDEEFASDSFQTVVNLQNEEEESEPQQHVKDIAFLHVVLPCHKDACSRKGLYHIARQKCNAIRKSEMVFMVSLVYRSFAVIFQLRDVLKWSLCRHADQHHILMFHLPMLVSMQ